MEQATKTEEMLWSLTRAHQRRAGLARWMAVREQSLGRAAPAARLHDRGRGNDDDASVVEQLLREHRSTVPIANPEADDAV